MSAPKELPLGTVTFVFTDIEGSTRLLTRLDADYPALLARHHSIMRAAIAANRGTEVKTDGDAFFVVFPIAQDAIAFAAAAQRALNGTDWGAADEVLVRMGIHTGAGMLADNDYVGIDVHRAARVSAAAHGGQVLLSGATEALLESAAPGVTLHDLGEHRLRDLPEPMRIFELVIAGLPTDFPPIRSIGRGNLPEQLTSFVGRETEIESISHLIDGARLVTLTGPGGTGKTRLSIEVARSVESAFTDGAWFVALDTITDPELVAPAIARAMGVKEDPARPAIVYLAAALAQRQALIVLDNFEQVVAAAPHVNQLLRDAPAPRILCSSREALRIGGEQEFAVPPMAAKSAATLFIERAQQARPSFAPNDEELQTISDICRAVDGLPLAIELAAARIRLFPLNTLLARLTDRLGMLEGGRRDVTERQRTLRGAIEWSYDLLDDSEREIFIRLAVFAGGADLAAVEAVIDPRADVTANVLREVESLIDKSLVTASDGPNGEPRFAMLETIRAFASEKLSVDPEWSQLSARHLAYYTYFAEAIESDLTTARSDTAFERVEADHDNIRTAMGWAAESGAAAGGLRIGGAIWRFWQQRGHLGEGRALLERLIPLATPDDPVGRGRGLTGYGGILYWQGDYVHAQAVYEEALSTYRTARDQRNEALALFDLGFTMSVNRELGPASRMMAESERLYASLGDEPGRLMVAEGRAAVALIARDLEQARDIAEGVVDEYGRLGMKFRQVDTLGLLAGIYLELGDIENAYRRWSQWATLWLETRDMSVRPLLFEFGARLALSDGRPKDGARLLGALQAMRDHNEPFLLPGAVMGLRDTEADIKAVLPAAEWSADFEEGRGWPMDAAIVNAIELVRRHPGS